MTTNAQTLRGGIPAGPRAWRFKRSLELRKFRDRQWYRNGGREANGENGPLAGAVAVGGDVPAVGLDDGVGDGKAQARAVAALEPLGGGGLGELVDDVGAGAALLGEERLEDPLQGLWRHALTGVTDGELDRAVAAGGVNADFAGLFAEAGDST